MEHACQILLPDGTSFPEYLDAPMIQAVFKPRSFLTCKTRAARSLLNTRYISRKSALVKGGSQNAAARNDETTGQLSTTGLGDPFDLVLTPLSQYAVILYPFPPLPIRL
jgi:hypothetical protein